MNTVERSQAEAFFIRPNDKFVWAKIFMQEGCRTDGGFWVYLAIVSDFGTFGYCWSHCGQPAREFLADLEFEYAMEKLTGYKLRQFDFDKSVANLRATAKLWRREGSIKKDAARALFDAAEVLALDGVMSAETFATNLYEELGQHGRNMDLTEWACKYSPRPDCVGFWKEIWPLFIAALKNQVATA